MAGTSPEKDTETPDTGAPDTATPDAATSDNTIRDAATSDNANPDAATQENPDSERAPYHPALIATAVALPVALLVGVLVAAVIVLRGPTERDPLALGPIPAPAADGPACSALLPALPADFGEFTRSTLVEPAPPATAAWQRPDGGEAVVLRCGLDRPLEFNRASPLQVVNGVQWFEVRDETAATATWFAVDRETYIALTVPDDSGPTPLQAVSDTLTAHLPAQPLDPGELPN